MLRQLKAKDILDFYGFTLPYTLKGVVSVDEDGEVKAIAGYYLQGTSIVVFSDVKEGANKRDIVKGARMVIDMVRGFKMDVLGTPDHNGVTALRHFGFEPFTADEEVWRLSK